MLPALWRAAEDRQWFTRLPDDALVAVEARLHRGTTSPTLLLQRAYDDNAVRTRELLVEGDAIARALAEAGITYVPLKGWHTILDGWWNDPATRVLRDLDVLVPEADAPRALDVLTQAGFAPIDEPLDDYADHQLPAIASPRHPLSVEIHTALAVSRWREVLPAADVLAAARGGRMSTTHAVIHSIVHAELHDEAHLLRHLPLRALHELAVVAQSAAASAIDWDEVRSRFGRAGRRASAALDAHLGSARSLFGAQVPARSAPSSSARVRAHLALCQLELVSPRAARAYRATVFVPRAWGEARLHRLYGDGNVWRLRARHVRRRLRFGRPAGGS